MKKGFKSYITAWAVLLVMFNITVFAVPDSAAGMSKFGGAFWSGYALITLTFIGQLFCAKLAFGAENKERLFLDLPLITISYSALIAAVVTGAVCMAVPGMPNWAGVVICALLLGFNAVAVIKANAAAQLVSDVDEKTAARTQFVKMAAADAQNIMNRAKSDGIREECKKVYEALRYSDPVSSDALSAEEAEITSKMAELAAAVNGDNAQKVSAAAEEAVLLIKERNNKCRALK